VRPLEPTNDIRTRHLPPPAEAPRCLAIGKETCVW